MKKKLIISESQFNRLKAKLNESNIHASFVKQLRTELDNHYEPVNKFVREGGEYSESIMVKNKIDEEEMSIADLYEYMNYKFKIKEENYPLVKQIIKDWIFGNITDDNRLSANIPLK